MEAEIARPKAEAAARDRELEKVREGFSRDLEKLRETAAQSGERLRATEKRALLQIDRELGAVAKLQKEVDETTKRAEKREAEHRRAVEALQAQLGDARHQAGVLQGRLDAVEAANVLARTGRTCLQGIGLAHGSQLLLQRHVGHHRHGRRARRAGRHQHSGAPQAGRDGWKVDFRVRDSEFAAPATDM